MKKIIVFLLVLSFILSHTYSNAYAETDPVSISAISAVLVEGTTGKVIYEKDKDKELIPASITKIMTLILIFEALDKGVIKENDMVTVSDYAASMGGSQVFLEPGETQTVHDMIKCISIASANDAAVAMAEKVAGSESEFVKMMNVKASSLGMKHTSFKNCTGLDDDIKSGHFSSAYDVALMSRELIMKHPQISEFSTKWMDKISHTTKKGTSEFGLTNTNKLVRFYQGITGLKTGSTSKAKYCLSSTAKRKNMNMIFAKCSIYTENTKKLTFEPIPIQGGITRSLLPVPETSFSYTFTEPMETKNITRKTTYHAVKKAPLEKGAPCGKICCCKFLLNSFTFD